MFVINLLCDTSPLPTGLDWKLVARYSGLRCRRRRIYTKSVKDRELAVGRISVMFLSGYGVGHTQRRVCLYARKWRTLLDFFAYMSFFDK